MARTAAAAQVWTGTPLPPSYTLPGGAGCQAATPWQVTPATGQRVLTVGAGMQFQTVAAAVAASANGDLILVQPGTYTNDFADITTQITIAGAGGMVDMVATVAPPNDKGIFVVDNNVEIDNLIFQNVAIPDSVGGNGAGIRYQGGAMVLHNDAFLNNQNGLLAAAVDGLPTNTVSITGCTFDNNGATTGIGVGYTHNLYVSTGITSLVASGNIFEQANIGHEFKSRAVSNLITGNVFYDGPTGTASYDIDLPNGGADTITGNIIEKGPMAQNTAMIHFGGEGIPYAGSGLTITGNHFINDLGPAALGLLNQTTQTINITGNEFDNFASATIGEGLFTQSGNVDQNGTPIAQSSSIQFAPGTDLDDFSQDSLAHSVTLTGAAGVLGGGGLVTVTDDAGHVTVIGGSGGLEVEEAPGLGGSYIATAAGAADTVVALGQDVVASAGNDSITGGAGNLSVQVDGNAAIAAGSGNSSFIVNGTAQIAGGGGGDTIQANAPGASAFITGPVSYLQVTVSGGNAGWDVTQGGGAEQATITGGASATRIYGATMNVTTAGAGDGSVIAFGAGAATVMSLGADTIHAGSGAETVIVSGSSQIFGGTGALSVFGRSESGQASVFGAGGSIAIAGDTGDITYVGGQAANTVTASLSNITLQGGAGQMVVVGGSRQSVTGGAGGMVFTTTGGADAITTQAGAHDSLTFAGACQVVSNGTDILSAGAGNSTITANGNATITGSTGNALYTLNGADSLAAYGNTRATVGAGAHDTIAAYGTGTAVTLSAGGTLAFSQRGNADHEAVTLTGAGASLSSWAPDTLTAVTLGGAGDGVVLGAGQESVSVTALGAKIWAGSGSDTVTLWQGGGTLHAGAGAVSVIMNDWVDQAVTTIFGGGGALSLAQGSGNLVFDGGRGTAILGGVSGGETVNAAAGNISLVGGNGGTKFTAGTGTASVNLTTAGGTVIFGHAATAVTEAAWGSADIYDFNAGHGGGSDTITGFRVGTDQLVFNGVSVTGTAASGGSTLLTLSDGTQVTLAGISTVTAQGLHLHV